MQLGWSASDHSRPQERRSRNAMGTEETWTWLIFMGAEKATLPGTGYKARLAGYRQHVPPTSVLVIFVPT